MKKHMHIILIGIISSVFLAASILYSLLYDHGNLVYPTDFSTYHFTVKNIPILASTLLFIAYVFYLVFYLIKIKMNTPVDHHHTKKVSPYLGFLGLFGFFGFFGFSSYQEHHLIYPFIFFVFFGFFGFFYEGKLSNTLKDELFLENERKADIKAYRTGFSLLFLVLWLVGMGLLSKQVEWCAIFMVIAISLIYALTLFLSKYFLYRFEKET